MIGLHAARGDQGVAAVGQGFSKKKFQLADFIARGGGTSEIVALNPDARLRQARSDSRSKRIERRGRLGQIELSLDTLSSSWLSSQKWLR